VRENLSSWKKTMKNYHLTPGGQTRVSAIYRLQEEKDGRWTLNEEGIAIGVFESKSEALVVCLALVNEHPGSLRIHTPNGIIKQWRPHRAATAGNSAPRSEFNSLGIPPARLAVRERDS
jgi:hypothetical protein